MIVGTLHLASSALGQLVDGFKPKNGAKLDIAVAVAVTASVESIVSHGCAHTQPLFSGNSSTFVCGKSVPLRAMAWAFVSFGTRFQWENHCVG